MVTAAILEGNSIGLIQFALHYGRRHHGFLLKKQTTQNLYSLALPLTPRVSPKSRSPGYPQIRPDQVSMLLYPLAWDAHHDPVLMGVDQSSQPHCR